MNDQLDHAIRSVTADIVAATPQRTPTPVPSRSNQSDQSSRRWLAVAAGLLLLAGAGGLAVSVNRNLDPGPSAAPTEDAGEPAPIALNGDLTSAVEIGPSDWVVPNDLAEIGELQYGAAEPGIGQRALHYGPIGEPARLDITIDTLSSSTTGTPVDVNGVEWKETEAPGFWSAERSIGDTVVRVSSAALDPLQGRLVLSNLAVVPAAALQSEPLDSSVLLDPQTAPVATYTTGSRTLTMRAAQQNGYYCTFTDDSNGGHGGGCGELFDPATSWASGGVHGYDYEYDSLELTVKASGIVATDVETVEIDFINDVTITVSPTDLTETFPVRFWIAGATIELEPGQDPTGIPNSVIEVRGLDEDGNILYTQTTDSGTVPR